MSKQTIALAYTRPADALEESEYQALAEALTESARGRAFLAEHARRSRSAETNILLTAIERIESQVRPREPAPDPLHDDLRRLLDEVRTARSRIETGGAAPKLEQLAALLDLVQRRLTTLSKPSPPAGNQPATRAAAAAPASSPRPSAARWLEEPLAPPPPVNDAGPRPRTTFPAETAAREAPATEIESGIQAMIATEVRSKTTSPPVASAAAEPAATAVQSADDALAAIMALSEEERIALFT